MSEQPTITDTQADAGVAVASSGEPDPGGAPVGVGALTARGQQSPATAPMAGQVLPPRRKKRRVVLPLILLIIMGGAGFAGYRYLTDWRFIVSTDDAYVKADVSIVAAKVSGYVEAVPVVENTPVKAGDLLVKIDDGDYRIAADTARDKIATQEATIVRLGRQAEAQKAVIAQAQAQLVAAQADVARTSLAYDRALALAKNSYTTKATLDQTLADKQRTAANVAAAKAAVESARANLAVMLAQQEEAKHTKVELRSALAMAERDLGFTSIKAPFDGVIGNRAAQPGQYVTPGTRLMALVPMRSAYVEANFKETQLGLIKPGQAVDIEVDAYAGRKIHGVVESFAPASGSQFSLLPPENATGNFTKIVQRVPVRIRVPEEVAREGILRPGLSVVASVHTRDERLPPPSILAALGLDRLAASWFGFGSQAAQPETPPTPEAAEARR